MKTHTTELADIADVFTPPVGFINCFRAHIARAHGGYPPYKNVCNVCITGRNVFL